MTEKSGDEENQPSDGSSKRPKPKGKGIVLKGLFSSFIKVLSQKKKLKTVNWKKLLTWKKLLIIGGAIGVVVGILIIILFLVPAGETQKPERKEIRISVSDTLDSGNHVAWYTLRNKEKSDTANIYAIVAKNRAGKKVLLRRWGILKSLEQIAPDSSISVRLESWELDRMDSLYFYFLDQAKQIRHPIRVVIPDIS